jgi:hypothetical protein
MIMMMMRMMRMMRMMMSCVSDDIHQRGIHKCRFLLPVSINIFIYNSQCPLIYIIFGVLCIFIDAFDAQPQDEKQNDKSDLVLSPSFLADSLEPPWDRVERVRRLRVRDGRV